MRAPGKRRTHLDVIAGRLGKALKTETGNIIAIGKILHEARAACAETGEEFLLWLAEHFGMSQRTAYNYMSAADYAKRFATVANGNVAPRVLYDLANGEFDDEVAGKIRKEARTKRVGYDRAQQIQLDWQCRHNAKELRETEPEIQRPEARSLDEIDHVPDPPPPDVPRHEPAKPVNLLVPLFDDTIGKLKKLVTKQPATFADTSYTPDDLQNYAEQFADLLRAVANLLRKTRTAA